MLNAISKFATYAHDERSIMAHISIPAIYDGERIQLLETAPVEGPYHVLVTFVDPASRQGTTDVPARFWDSFGAWRDDRLVEDTLRDIRETRRSRAVPLTL